MNDFRIDTQQPDLQRADAQPLTQQQLDPQYLDRPHMGPIRAFASSIKWLGAYLLAFFAYLGVEIVAELVFGRIPALNQGAGLMVNVCCQLSVTLVFGLWMAWLRPRSFARQRALERPLSWGSETTVARVILILELAVVLYVVVSVGTDLFWSLFPDMLESYAEGMEASGTNDLNLASFLTVSVGAPIAEELVVRGVFFEFILRAFNAQSCWQWKRSRRDALADQAPTDAPVRGCGHTVTPATFWLANIVQALTFGVMHGNLVQGSYTFFCGLIFGWVMWRTGRLRYNMLLHFGFNTVSFVAAYFIVDGGVFLLLETVGSVVAAVLAARYFDRACCEEPKQPLGAHAVRP